MRILIVEDDSLFAEILQTFVEEKKCSSIVTEDIAAAKAQLAASEFQLVLVDNKLPEGDGVNALEQIREASLVPLPIIMITADDNPNLLLKAYEKGVDDFLVKPLSLDLLWQKVKRVCLYYDKERQMSAQTEKLEKLLDKQEQEENLARYVYEHVSSNLQTETECVDTYLQSSSAFNGDVFICDSGPNGNRFVILADATGHGLSAAISILPLVGTIRAMIRKGLSLPHMVHEANKKLCVELPDDKFVTLIGVEINFNTKQLTIFNGGMPDIVVLKHDRSTERLQSTSLALGILDPEDFDPAVIKMETDNINNLFFFSDGLIEQQNMWGDEFGMERLMRLLDDHDSADPLVSKVINHFTIFNEMNELQDDLSVCDLQVSALMDAHLYENKSDKKKKTGKLIAEITIEGSLIAVSDLVSMFDGLMRASDMVGDLRQKAFTVFAELISNALDHGVLGLDSSLKNDFTGFAEYLSLKEERLENIGESESLKMSFAYDPKAENISFSIKDSGKGYDFEATKEMSDAALSGRGIALIKQLCSQVEVVSPGNHTSIQLQREI